MTRQTNVLITGMSGLIGGVVRQQLTGRYALSALNRSAVEGVPCHQADIANLDAILPAFQDIDVVVHLSAIAHGGTPWEDLLPTNVVGTYNVFEAARRAGVKRVIYASSGATISGWEREDPYGALVEGRYDDVGDSWPMITHQTPTRPNGLYGVTKVWGEALARHFTDTTELSILCLRIGHVTQDDQPHGSRDAAVWCSQRDIATMVECCITAPAELKYDIFFVVSNNQWRYRDMEHAREGLGFEPQD
ncbi:MAG: NAD(P)-dependent oxidoreductase [Chloroflexota bacterium]